MKNEYFSVLCNISIIINNIEKITNVAITLYFSIMKDFPIPIHVLNTSNNTNLIIKSIKQ